jgi:hypothetical protein
MGVQGSTVQHQGCHFILVSRVPVKHAHSPALASSAFGTYTSLSPDTVLQFVAEQSAKHGLERIALHFTMASMGQRTRAFDGQLSISPASVATGFRGFKCRLTSPWRKVVLHGKSCDKIDTILRWISSTPPPTCRIVTVLLTASTTVATHGAYTMASGLMSMANTGADATGPAQYRIVAVTRDPCPTQVEDDSGTCRDVE